MGVYTENTHSMIVPRLKLSLENITMNTETKYIYLGPVPVEDDASSHRLLVLVCLPLCNVIVQVNHYRVLHQERAVLEHFGKWVKKMYNQVDICLEASLMAL